MTSPKSITAAHAVRVLNRALRADSAAMAQLIATRVPCNTALANDATIQVCTTQRGQQLVPVVWSVGVLGLINGLFYADGRGNGAIVLRCDDAGRLTRFQTWDSAVREQKRRAAYARRKP
jgi:hypothetical protein